MVVAGVLDRLRERGLVQQVTLEEELRALLDSQPVSVYLGIDPTADSLHVGHLRALMMLVHLQQAGHRPILVVGGGTAMIGDPSGKTEMRRMLSRDTIVRNTERIRRQLERLLDFSDGRALLVDNAEWLLPLNYIAFLREIGSQFSVNQMLTAEAFKTRLERGLSFIEFNYMLLQAYDFLVLYRRHGCRLQVGGDDQWSNILAGVDLIRRLERGRAYGLTCPLAVTAGGQKMGKTERGAVWLDPEKTPPWDFFQFWRNVDDADLTAFLAIYTLLPLEEVRALAAMPADAGRLNAAKERLAYEATRLIHGEAAAREALATARALFGGEGGQGAAPATEVSRAELAAGLPVVEALVRCGLAPSRSEARRLIAQGGIYLNERRLDTDGRQLSLADLADGRILLRKGKKVYHQLVLAGDAGDGRSI